MTCDGETVSCTHRLFQMMQSLLRLLPPVTASKLSEDVDESFRTKYCDIDTLRSLGAITDGEQGLGLR